MNDILWLQNPKEGEEIILLLDGKNITPPTDPLFIKTSNELASFDSYSYKKGNNFILYKVNDGWLLKGNFDTLDSLGRKAAFMFYSNRSIDIDNFLSLLRVRSRQLNMEYGDFLENTVQALFREWKKAISAKTMLIVAAIVIALIIILSILLSGNSGNGVS